MPTNITAHIRNACEIKEQMHRMTAAMYDRIGTDAWNPVDHEDAVKVAIHQYAPAVRAVVEATTPEDLAARRDRLNDRLDQGFDWCNANMANGDAQQTWCQLLTEYEVICDAINHIGLINGTLDRLDWIAALHVPEAALVQGRLA